MVRKPMTTMSLHAVKGCFVPQDYEELLRNISRGHSEEEGEEERKDMQYLKLNIKHAPTHVPHNFPPSHPSLQT